ncbi:RidA family protein [Photobacterium leiognathi]|uniref:RidA family protein n=1 Tax=Photobacterium leiognathi TaxID=553611 RepID=A0A2T3ME17_PHOLE|nr:RidA family protein [Photobacterium leiognathi]KJF99077.1 endoribonuclease L-PSP [Photobacterium leiognathi]PSV91895.1 RidA family protein [Photobacterium leiognathi]PSW53486.1 RidA family protein [Photobacterium leiognathi subsp. mandapamensis]
MKKSIVPEEFKHYYNDWHFSPVIEADGTVYLSGVTAARKDKPISIDPQEQFHDAFYKLGVYLDAAGLTYDDILEMTTFHIDLKAHIEVFSKVKDEYVKPPYPAWSAIGVSEFIPENALVEMRVVAKKFAITRA